MYDVGAFDKFNGRPTERPSFGRGWNRLNSFCGVGQCVSITTNYEKLLNEKRQIVVAN